MAWLFLIQTILQYLDTHEETFKIHSYPIMLKILYKFIFCFPGFINKIYHPNIDEA